MGRCHAPKIAEAMAVASYSKDDNRILLLMGGLWAAMPTSL